ncbi:hypothetical protein G3A43_06205 [Paraburkholderia aspalathi]|nr:hypothetical protein [Paraburkholderia aspalathi]MBK3779840.1 hypothetical protein [Paraburkholderia aspalathi]
MFTAATPAALVFTFPQAKTEFLAQVEVKPCPGQRHHQEQNAAGRTHIQQWEVPPTQAVIHAVRVKGKMTRCNRKLLLIDGYHRLLHWFGMDRCPFQTLVVLVYEIEADTREQLDGLVDILARTIDSKKAVKRNVDRWCAAVRDAGLEKPKSKAYKVGTKANSFFKRVLKSADDSMVDLTKRARENIDAHRVMDELFAFSETEMRSVHATSFFHAGVQTAVFQGLCKLPVEKHQAASQQLRELLLKLDMAQSSVSHRLAVISKEVAAIYDHLVLMASPEKDKELRAKGNREEFYNAVVEELKPLVEAFVSSVTAGKKRIRKAS